MFNFGLSVDKVPFYSPLAKNLQNRQYWDVFCKQNEYEKL